MPKPAATQHKVNTNLGLESRISPHKTDEGRLRRWLLRRGLVDYQKSFRLNVGELYALYSKNIKEIFLNLNKLEAKWHDYSSLQAPPKFSFTKLEMVTSSASQLPLINIIDSSNMHNSSDQPSELYEKYLQTNWQKIDLPNFLKTISFSLQPLRISKVCYWFGSKKNAEKFLQEECRELDKKIEKHCKKLSAEMNFDLRDCSVAEVFSLDQQSELMPWDEAYKPKISSVKTNLRMEIKAQPRLEIEINNGKIDFVSRD